VEREREEEGVKRENEEERVSEEREWTETVGEKRGNGKGGGRTNGDRGFYCTCANPFYMDLGCFLD
jgi:hypothetical protein